MNSLRTVMTPDRLSVLSRALAASLGGYVVVNLSNLALSYLLPVPQYQGLLFAMMISFIFYTLIIIWAFAVRTAKKAWLGLAVVALPLALVNAVYYFSGVSP